MTADLISFNYGSIVTLTPQTDAGREWLVFNLADSNLPFEPECDDLLWPINIEPRYFLDIAVGALEDGLTMEDGATGRLAHLP